MRLIAEIGSAWRASPRKPAPWSCGSKIRCMASRIAITGPREPTSAAIPTASAAPSRPEVSTIANAVPRSPRCGVGVPSASTNAPAKSTASVIATSTVTMTHAPPTRDRKSAVRERPVAARSRNTPVSRSCAPAVAPTIAPTRNAISDMIWRLSVKPFSPPAGGFLIGCAPCWSVITTNASSRMPSVSPAQTASMPRRRRSFSTSLLMSRRSGIRIGPRDGWSWSGSAPRAWSGRGRRARRRRRGRAAGAAAR